MSFLLFGLDWYKHYKGFQFCSVFWCESPETEEVQPSPLLAVFKEKKLWSVCLFGFWVQFGS